MILEINGQAITGIDTLIELAGSLEPRQHVTLIAVDHRNGNVGAVRVVLK
jgi:hypothetical protein